MDYCTEEGAYQMARRLESYWHKRGYGGILTRVVATPAERNELGNNIPVFAIRSNIGRDGFPPKQIAMEYLQ